MKSTANLASLLGTDRNILQIRIGRTESSRGRDVLREEHVARVVAALDEAARPPGAGGVAVEDGAAERDLGVGAGLE